MSIAIAITDSETEETVEVFETEEEFRLSRWTEGKYRCDCYRANLFRNAHGWQPCGEGRYRIRVTDETGHMVYRDSPEREEERASRTVEEIDHWFTYHAPLPDQIERYQSIQHDAKELALTIADSCPDSREKSLAMTHLQEVVLWAHASIALHENRER
jgi:hypothetical protein